MCGIYGIVDPQGAVDRNRLVRARDRLAHRGPDDAGLWISPSGTVALAHRRLAIIDLSPGGHQPMATPDGRCVIVFNGEIYNYRELRAVLEAAGVSFRTASDTEVILAAYQTWGDACLARLNGMFAFVIHDAGDSVRDPSLFFARDRVGEKPLYYRASNGRFEFASELKAIEPRGELDLDAINHYLALGYVPGALCLAKDVAKLPPAHAGRLDLASMKLRLWQYWALPSSTADGISDGERLADEAGKLLVDSVRLRMISDVPLGVLLSGGLDSSLVVAAAARESTRPVKTFTIAIPGSPLDEAAHAERVARHFATEHHVLPLGTPGLAVLDDIAPWVDEPIADSSIIPAFLVSRLTRHHVTVALGGDGGDELFGGYRDYTAGLNDQARLGWVPAPALRAAAGLVARLPAGVRGRNRIASLREGPLQQMIWGSTYFDQELRRRILGPDIVSELGVRLDAPERLLLSLFSSGSDPVDRMTRTHFGSVLPDDFLVKVDRASMAVSLEIRAPFLDHRLVEFAFGRVPSRWKVTGGESRRIQRILARRWLPAEANFSRKQGFSIPLDEWLRADGCERVRSVCATLPDWIQWQELDDLIAGQLKGRANGARLFALMMLAFALGNAAAGP